MILKTASKACASGSENENLTFGKEKFAGESVKISRSHLG